MFMKTSTHTHLILSKKWTNLQWRPDHSVDSYLAEIAQLRAQHKSAGCTLSDDVVFVKLLTSLPAAFDTEASLMEDWAVPDLDRARTLLLKCEAACRKRKFEEYNAPVMDVSAFSFNATSPVNGGTSNL